MSYIYDVPHLLSHMWTNLFSFQGLVIMYRLHLIFILLLVVLYLLSPFDLLPEIILGIIGLIDDVVIVIAALVYVSLIYRAYVARMN